MKMPAHVCCVIGTRPEALKMIPVINALAAYDHLKCITVSTGQHKGLLDQVFELFGLRPDIELHCMQENQSLNALGGRLLSAVGEALAKLRPAAVLAQGDTSSVLMSALASFHLNIPFGHVEAGLRTGDLHRPFPEEMNRSLTAKLTKWHFAPTLSARKNLISEGVSSESIYLTGNTIVDMVLEISSQQNRSVLHVPDDKKIILVTCHRRENHGAPLHRICRAILSVADRFSDVQIVFSVHPNPAVRPVVMQYLQGHSRIMLTEPLDYPAFISLMKKSVLILSDSGGIQEEATVFGIPVVLLRAETERPEGILEGFVYAAGTSEESILELIQDILSKVGHHQTKRSAPSPYGDGCAGKRIAAILASAIP